MLAILIYFIAVLIIGFSYAKRSNSSRRPNTSWAAARSVPWFTALSAEASDMSRLPAHGPAGTRVLHRRRRRQAGHAIGLALGTYLNWLLVAKRLRRYSEVAGDAITLPGFYSNRFHDDQKRHRAPSPRSSSSSSSASTPAAALSPVASSSIRCLAWTTTLMMVFGAIIVFLYTMVGGYLSVVATDFLQGMSHVLCPGHRRHRLDHHGRRASTTPSRS